MRAVILTFGSKSVETVELEDRLLKRGFVVSICHPRKFAITLADAPILTYGGKPFPRPDVVITRTGSATGVHAANIIRQIESSGILVLNGLASVQACLDKILTLQIAAAAGVPIPKTIICSAENPIAWPLDWPAIFKLATGSHGRGVVLLRSESELDAQIDLLKATDPRRPFLIQEYVAHEGTRDLRVVVVGGRAVAAMLRSAQNGAFRTNSSGHGTGKGEGSAFTLTPEIARMAEAMAQRMKLAVAGVDLLFSPTGPVLCEVNSAPGWKTTTPACGIDVADRIAAYVQERCRLASGNHLRHAHEVRALRRSSSR